MCKEEFGNIVLNNVDELKPFAITLTRDYEKAKDLCQETLYKAFAYRENYKPNTNIKAWLYTIMRNIFINDYRRSKRKQQVVETYHHIQHNHFVSAESDVQLKDINTAIHCLPKIFKSACILYLHGYKYQEIAYVLNEPLGTIKSRIHFAKKILQQQIDR